MIGFAVCARCFYRGPIGHFDFVDGEDYCSVVCEPTQGERRAARKLAAAQKAYRQHSGMSYSTPEKKREARAAWQAVKKAEEDLRKQQILGAARRRDIRIERGMEPLARDAP